MITGKGVCAVFTETIRRAGRLRTHTMYCRGRVKLTIRDPWRFSNDIRESSDDGSQDSVQAPVSFGMLRPEDTTD